MTADVVAFLRAALDEIERVAGAAIEDTESAEWATNPSPNELVVRIGARVEDERVFGYGSAAHIALHDPRAALARVQAERQVVNEYEVWDAMRNERTAVAADLLLGVVRTLAHGHRHTVPGFDPAWAPEGVSADA